MDILLVGAGAVGQAYGLFLHQGGASVSFLVKEKYASDLASGLRIYPLNAKPRPTECSLEGFQTLTHIGQVGERCWDQVWLCTSTDALLSGTWFAELAEQAGRSTVVTLQPGAQVLPFLRSHCPEDRIVSGLITLIAYRCPLPGEPLLPGVACWIPPLTSTPFSGSPMRVQMIVATLRRGGCPAKANPATASQGAFATAALQPAIVALEGAGWQMHNLRKSPLLPLAAKAAREAIEATAADLGATPPFYRRILSGFFYRRAFGLVSRLAPFDLETYLKIHFSKVGIQTRQLLATYIAMGKRLERPTAALELLTQEVFGEVDPETQENGGLGEM
ncbi:MAG: hypothetical protein JW797_20315 [Bradymonadales bacterium]|nr:hypothetical protein [Bradymonadales bacterium]